MGIPIGNCGVEFAQGSCLIIAMHGKRELHELHLRRAHELVNDCLNYDLNEALNGILPKIVVLITSRPPSYLNSIPPSSPQNGGDNCNSAEDPDADLKCGLPTVNTSTKRIWTGTSGTIRKESEKKGKYWCS